MDSFVRMQDMTVKEFKWDIKRYEASNWPLNTTSFDAGTLDSRFVGTIDGHGTLTAFLTLSKDWATDDSEA